jgi:hypothetical protein
MPHVFDEIRELAQLDDDTLRGRFSSETVASVVTCSGLLRSSSLSASAMTPESFASEVRRLNSECVCCSRALGDALVNAAECADAGDIEAAQEELRNFAACCDAPFYRRIANAQLAAVPKGKDA